MRSTTLFLAVILVVAAVPTGVAAETGHGAPQSVDVRGDVAPDEVVVETTFSLREVGTDEIRVVKEYHIGSDVRTLEKNINYPIEDVSTRNVGRSGDTFEWDGTGDVARIEFVAAAADLGPDGVETTRGDGYAVVGATTEGLRSDADEFGSEVSISGTGTAGNQFAVLGGYEAFTRDAPNGQYRVVLPDHVNFGQDAASLRANIESSLDAIAYTDRQLDAGVQWDGEATYFLVEADLGRYAGLTFGTYGSSDAPGDVLMRAADPTIAAHEAVHQLKQDYTTGESARWTREASAEYYAYLFSWQQGVTRFEYFDRALRPMAPDSDQRLDAPGSWEGYQTPYKLGGSAALHLDRKIRAATDSQRSFEDVLRRMNDHDGTLTHDDVRDIVVDVGGSQLGPVVDEYVTTDAVAPAASNPYEFTDPDVESDLSFAAAGSNETNLTMGGRFPNMQVTLENTGPSPALAVGLNVSLPEGWYLLGVAKTKKGAQYQRIESVPGADVGYFQLPAHNTTNFTVYMQRPDNRTPGTYQYEIAARDLSGEWTTRGGTITVESNTEPSEDDETEQRDTTPPSSAVEISIDDADRRGQTTVENRSLPVYQKGTTMKVTVALDNETYRVDRYSLRLLQESSQSKDGEFTHSLDVDGVQEFEASVTLENGATVERSFRVVVNDDVEIYDIVTARYGTKVRLEAEVLNHVGYHNVTWFVDGEQVGSGDVLWLNRLDEEVEVRAVAEGEFGGGDEARKVVEPKWSLLGLGLVPGPQSRPLPWLVGGGALVVGVVIASWLWRR